MGRVLFFLGKGGVGKSTVSTAAALQLAAGGKRVLLVSLDQAHNVGDILDVSLGDTPRKVQDNLDVAESDLKKWVKAYLTKTRQEMQAQYRYNVSLNLDRYIDVMKHSPGTEEYAVLWSIEHYVQEYADSHDLIIFDTPPTALTIRFLSMPSVTGLWIKELTKMRKKILRGRRNINRINPQALPVAGALSEEGDAVYGNLGLLDARLAKINKLLSCESYFSVVINNDRLSTAESKRIYGELKNLGICLNSFCLNKITSPDEDLPHIDGLVSSIARFRMLPSAAGVETPEGLGAMDLGGLVGNIVEWSRH